MYWIPKNILAFPDHHHASKEGILAVGGDLSIDRLLLAYSNGIFPWYNDGDPIFWWSPDPRFVLFPDQLKVSKSMRSYFNQHKFNVSFDQSFREVILQCQKSKRKGQSGGTWIVPDMVEAYCNLHKAGFAHSVEVWQGEELVGGLYGVALGKVFFGESMFTKVSNASKFGFIYLVKQLIKHEFQLIDCQQETKHLASMGATNIARSQFLNILAKNKKEVTLNGNWQTLLI